LGGACLEGTWFDRTAESRARRRGEKRPTSDFTEPERIELSPLPCWDQLDQAAYRLKVAELLRDIVECRRARGGERVSIQDVGAYELWVLFADGFESGDTTAWSAAVP
jgi:hypothetical protein